MADHLLRCLDHGLVMVFPGTRGCQNSQSKSSNCEDNNTWQQVSRAARNKGPSNHKDNKGPSNRKDNKGLFNCTNSKGSSNRVENNAYKTK